MKQAKRTCTISIGLCVLVAPMLGQPDRGVMVSHAGTEITISVSRPTPLGTVLDEVCRETSSECLGTQEAMNVLVPAQDVRGDWRQVTSTLLEGAGLNYVASAPSETSAGMLNIVGAASQGMLAQPEVRSTVAAKQADEIGIAGERPSDERALSSLPTGEAEPSTEVSSEPEASPVDAAAFSASPPAPPTSGAEESGQAQQAGGLEQANTGGQADSLFFPGGYGNPNPGSHQGLEYLPFLDAQGNLITVASQSSSPYLPFPDANGNAIPASNQALPYLPFRDGNGRLIPVQGGGH